MEGLNLAMQSAVESQLIRGIMVGNNNLRLSHLIYADDVVIFSEWSREDLQYILCVLKVFFLVSGLKINISKSHLFGIGVDDNQVTSFAAGTGCQVGLFPTKYLGVPIGTNMNHVGNWSRLIDKFSSRLSSWKANLISCGAPFSQGGLNVGSLKAFNLALLHKWKWRFIHCSRDLWVRVIKSIHGEVFERAVGNSPWANIVSACNNTFGVGLLPSDVIKIQVGSGEFVRFWHDIWTGSRSLASRFNRLFHLDVYKDDMVAAKRMNNGWNWVWSREQIGSRNFELLDMMRQEIEQIQFHDREDTWIWGLSPEGTFSVKSAQDCIDFNLLPSNQSTTTWYKFLPRKVNIFLWRFKLDKLPLRWNLSSVGLEINSVTCPVCNEVIEHRDHLFFGCSLASDLWSKVRRWMGCDMPIFSSWSAFVTLFETHQSSVSCKTRIISIVTTLLWVLRRFRNGIVFNDIVLRKCMLFDVIQLYSFNWLKHRGHQIFNWNLWRLQPL
ncbi:uncharacterized protein [Rutidosis leptorrhynchoides]|uniref:uncharacterized protein n=1 Tax=Rutidosis leptorrhynchoides TaxID=125765 RepID=UPI003A99C622